MDKDRTLPSRPAAGALAVTGPRDLDHGSAEAAMLEPFLESRGESLCRVAAHLGSQGLCQGTGGNFSVVVKHHPLELLITPSGRDKRSLLPADLLLIGPDGLPAADAGRRPSAEAPLHVAIVAATGAGAVLHTHSVAGTLLGEHYRDQSGFTLRGYEMLKGLASVNTHEAEVWVPVLPNSQDMVALRGEVEELLAGQPDLHGFLLSGHGLYTWGKDLFETRRHVEIFEFLFECISRRTRFEAYVG